MRTLRCHPEGPQQPREMGRQGPHEAQHGQVQKNNPRHQYMLGATQPERSFAEKALGVLVNTLLHKSEQCALAGQKANGSLNSNEEECCPYLTYGEPSSLLSTGEVTPAVLCPFLSFSIQKRYGRV